MTQQPTSHVQQPEVGIAVETDTLAKVMARAKDRIARLAGTEPESIRIVIEF